MSHSAEKLIFDFLINFFPIALDMTIFPALVNQECVKAKWKRCNAINYGNIEFEVTLDLT